MSYFKPYFILLIFVSDVNIMLHVNDIKSGFYIRKINVSA